MFFKGQFVPVLCKIGVKIAENVLETPRNRGQISGLRNDHGYTFEYRVVTPGGGGGG